MVAKQDGANHSTENLSMGEKRHLQVCKMKLWNTLKCSNIYIQIVSSTASDLPDLLVNEDSDDEEDYDQSPHATVSNSPEPVLTTHMTISVDEDGSDRYIS